jgi:hypothetical protein
MPIETKSITIEKAGRHLVSVRIGYFFIHYFFILHICLDLDVEFKAIWIFVFSFKWQDVFMQLLDGDVGLIVLVIDHQKAID